MHSATLSILIGVLALIAAGGFIIKGYNAKGVLFVAGVALMLFAVAFLGKPIGGEKATGLFYVDISNIIYNLMANRGGGLGLLIMVLIGFSAYMSHIGANDTVIRILSHPHQPWYFPPQRGGSLRHHGDDDPRANRAGCGTCRRTGAHCREGLRLHLHDPDERARHPRDSRRPFFLATFLRPS